jgi:hypothetical protein
MAGTQWLEIEWSYGLVALAYVLAAFSSLCAVSVIEQASHNCRAPAGARVAAHRFAVLRVLGSCPQERWHIDTVQKAIGRRPHLAMVAIYLGAGIFCAHYVGLQSTDLQWKDTDTDIPAKYDLATVIGTFLGAVLMAWWALAVASDDVFYKRTKAERLAVVRQEVTRTSSLVRTSFVFFLFECAGVLTVVVVVVVGNRRVIWQSSPICTATARTLSLNSCSRTSPSA